jgi:hypothetical protein
VAGRHGDATLISEDFVRLPFRPRVIGLSLLVAALLIGCVISTTTSAFKFAIPRSTTHVQTAFRAHMRDGSVVAYPAGATIGNGTIDGTGTRFDVTRTKQSAAPLVPLDSVIGLEVFERHVNPIRTAIYLPVSMAISTVATAALLVAIFGSCPTIYADSAGTAVLQAESFSYSVAPLLAKRDVDRLDVTPDSNGVIRLDVRNEALETHYIDQLELLEVRHGADELVIPAPRGTPVAVRNQIAPASARDRTGRDVGRLIAKADETVFATADSVLASAAGGGSAEDFLELTVPRVAGRDSLAVVLRARSSLLSTEVLYDYMLGRPGPRALDWMASDLSRITTLARVATWYTDHFGLRVSVWDGERWRQVVRLMDFGPVAWRRVGVVVPAFGRDSVRIRLSFVADEFRIDQATVSWDVRRTDPRTVAVSRISVPDSGNVNGAATALRHGGDRPLATYPGQRFFADFDVGRSASPRTFLVAASGYYTEWVRPQWIEGHTTNQAFSPGNTSIQDVLRSWIASKDSLERRFFTARVPVL